MKPKNNLESRIRKYLDQLFAGVGGSQQLFDLKEELAMNLKERIADSKILPVRRFTLPWPNEFPLAA